MFCRPARPAAPATSGAGRAHDSQQHLAEGEPRRPSRLYASFASAAFVDSTPLAPGVRTPAPRTDRIGGAYLSSSASSLLIALPGWSTRTFRKKDAAASSAPESLHK